MSGCEILAPAGGREALVAAVQNGAGAVYMGFGSFNARRSARNFSDEEFRDAVRYCHVRGVKVYLTLNTLLTDRELPALVETAKKASDYGVDAILVQDWGVFDILRRTVPDVPLHASTQMSVHTLSGVKEAADLGCTRAVLARELEREEIARIAAEAPIEVETFAHGALCMCYSGQCEMSAVIGSRSGNRGACAQPCRLPYGFKGKADGFPLSLKDSNLAPYVADMAGLGVSCLKLEGRLKRPEYVAAVTSIYASLLAEGRKPTAEEQKNLALAFSRSGFTEGYYLDRRGKAMFGTRGEDERWPEEWFSELRRAYEKENLRTVGVDFTLTVRTGEAMTLTAADCFGNSVTVSGAVPEAARSRAVTRQELAERLAKTGGTAFHLASCDVSLDDGLAVSAGALNAVRREALAALEEARAALPARRVLPYVPAKKIANPTDAPRLTVSIMRAEQLSPALAALAPEMIYIPLELLAEIDLAPYRGKTRFCAILPRIYRTRDEEKLRAQLLLAKERGVEAVALGNLGHFALVRDLGMELRGDWSLNVFNSASLAMLRGRGLETATLSFELRHEQMRDISKCIPCEAIVYGRLPLMIMENCIIANERGCKYLQTRCERTDSESACEKAPALLTDRMGEQFPVLRVFGCRNEIQNAKTLYLADKNEWRRAGLTYARVRFTTESAEECVRILRVYRGEDDYRPEGFTRGLFYRGVE